MAATARLIRQPLFFRSAWRMSLLLAGWQAALASALAVAAGLALTSALESSPAGLSITPRVVETVVPLALSLQAAVLFSPETEPALEILLACPRPLAWALLERLAAVFAVGAAIATAGSLAVLGLSGTGSLLQAEIRWIAPAVFLMGVAAFGTLMTRQGAYGTLLATLMWGGMLFGGDPLLTRFPFLWPLHVYLQPEATPASLYLANRLTLFVLGLAFIALAAWTTRDEERLLGSPTRS